MKHLRKEVNKTSASMPRILVSFKETGDSDYFNLVVSLETFVTMRYINLHLPYHTIPCHFLYAGGSYSSPQPQVLYPINGDSAAYLQELRMDNVLDCPRLRSARDPRPYQTDDEVLYHVGLQCGTVCYLLSQNSLSLKLFGRRLS